jgi:hypothetical protein
MTGWAGGADAIVSSPAVTSDAIGASGRTFSTIVSGPGQYRSASSRARPSSSAISSASSTPGTCTISGLKLGRPLAA